LILAITIEFNNACTTHFAVETFEKYKEAFGNVASAEMSSKKREAEYEFVLTNDKGEQMRFMGECTAGYVGEGPNGTYRILKMAGFSIEEEFIHTEEFLFPEEIKQDINRVI